MNSKIIQNVQLVAIIELSLSFNQRNLPIVHDVVANIASVKLVKDDLVFIIFTFWAIIDQLQLSEVDSIDSFQLKFANS